MLHRAVLYGRYSGQYLLILFSEIISDSHIGLPILDLGPDAPPTLFGGDILYKGDTPRDRLDGHEIHSQNDGIGGHILRRDLEPSSRGGTQINHASGRRQKVVLLVELHQFEGRTGAVALFSEFRRRGSAFGCLAFESCYSLGELVPDYRVALRSV